MLYTSHQMAAIHKGMLSYERVMAEGGARFTLLLPADAGIYSPEDYADVLPAAEDSGETASTRDIIRELCPKAYNDKRVVVIEDDPDMMAQIKAEVGVFFSVAAFTDGRSGFEGVRDMMPELVICDVMLPDITGYDIVRRMRVDDGLCDIPVIMLTALGDERHQIKGYEAGADDYMIKPCNYNLLIARSIQLIKWSLRHKRRNTAGSIPVEHKDDILMTNAADKRLKEKIELMVSQHIGDADFNIDRMAEMLCMGRTKLYGKMKDLTGVSPNKYLQGERLRMAAEMLRQGELSVSEIAYKVGMADAAYFSRCFKAKYGVAPGRYRKEDSPGE